MRSIFLFTLAAVVQLSENSSNQKVTKRIIIFSQPYAGSNFFCRLLAMYPNVVMLDEIFNRNVIDGKRITHQMLLVRQSSPDVYLDWILSKYKNTDKIVIFKLFYTHLRSESVVKYLINQNMLGLYVFLYRSDLLTAYVSKFGATDCKDPITIERESFRTFEYHVVSWYKDIIFALNKSSRDYLLVNYDKDFSAGESFRNMLNKLENFLNFPHIGLFQNLPFELAKSPCNLPDQIKNFGELESDILKYHYRAMNITLLDISREYRIKPNLSAQLQFGHNTLAGYHPTRLILFAQPRTGSNYLFHLLRRYPNVTLFDEIFHHSITERMTPDGVPIPTSILENRHEKPKQYLEWLWNQYQSSGKTLVGFKIFQGHLKLRKVKRALLNGCKNYKKVILFRSDLLAQYVSDIKALQTGIWFLRAKDRKREQKETKRSSDSYAKSENVTVRVNNGEIRLFERETLQWYYTVVSMLDQTNQKYFIIEYGRDLVVEKSTKVMLRKLEIFLNLAPMDHTQALAQYRCMTKQSLVPLQDQVSNWDKLRKIRMQYHNSSYTLHEFVDRLQPKPLL